MLYQPAKFHKPTSFLEAVETVKWEGDLLGGMEYIRDDYHAHNKEPNFHETRATRISAYNVVFVGMNKLFNNEGEK